MEEAEPGELAEVGTLTGGLKVGPLRDLMSEWGGGGVGQSVSAVVGGDQVGNDSIGFKEGDIRVGIIDSCRSKSV